MMECRPESGYYHSVYFVRSVEHMVEHIVCSGGYAVRIVHMYIIAKILFTDNIIGFT